MLRLVTPRPNRIDPVFHFFHPVNGGIEEQSDVRLSDNFVVKNQVPYLPGILSVLIPMVQTDLLHNSPFPKSKTRSTRMHFYFTAGIATQPASILHQNDLGPESSRADRSANARQTTACHQHVSLQLDYPHVRIRRRRPGLDTLRSQLVDALTDFCSTNKSVLF